MHRADRSSTSGKKHHNSFLTTTKGGVVKRTNRHLAALDFLLNIPMVREQDIKESGFRNINRIKFLERNIEEFENVEENQSPQYTQSVANAEDFPTTSDTFGFKRLHGIQSPMSRIPDDFRYLLLKISDQSAVVRHWEDKLLGRGNVSGAEQTPQSVLKSRMFFSRTHSYPVAVCSIITYDAGEEAKKMNKQKADDKKGLEVFKLPHRDWRGLSYKPLFKPLTEDESRSEYFLQHGYLYDPDHLDNPNLLFGAHRHELARSAVTGPMLSSLLQYANHATLKESLNEQFHERHPELPPSLTLSKIRSLKKSALLGCYQLDLEVATTALAVIYFERLCLAGIVTKFNRKLTMSVCLLLATKFNENVTVKHHDRIVRLLDFFDRAWEISRQEVFSAEFGAFVQLGFSLHVPQPHVHLVYTRLLKLLNKTSREYLKDDMENSYTQDVFELEQGFLSLFPSVNLNVERREEYVGGGVV